MSNKKKTLSNWGLYSYLVKAAKTLLTSLLHSFTLAEEMAPEEGRVTQTEGAGRAVGRLVHYTE